MSDAAPSATLDALVPLQAGARGAQPAYVLLNDRLEPAATVSFAALAERAAALAGGLARRGRPGDRVLLAFNNGLDAVEAFWGCLTAGLVPIPAPAPDPHHSRVSVARLQGIADSASPILALTSADLVDAAGHHVGDLLWSTVEAVRGEPAQTPAAWGAAATAYLQYTSGSTSAPRGVQISHDAVLAQCRALQAVVPIEPAHSRGLVWLPWFHDYGLIHGLIQPLFAGVTSYLMPTLGFMRRPLRWLEAVAAHRITHTGAPDFAYRACVEALARQPDWRGDLGSLEVASCGAEPVRDRTLAAFAEAFAPSGFRRSAFAPSYGLAEAVLAVTVARHAEGPRTLQADRRALDADRFVPAAPGGDGGRTLVSCGPPLPGLTLRIVAQDTSTPRAAGEVGEIWIAGPSVATGYWQNPPATVAAFGARLGEPDHTDGRGYLRTGDLGFLHDGELYVTGRRKDLLIVHGRNVYPQDLEDSAQQAHPGVRPGGVMAVATTRDDQESVTLLVECAGRPEPEDVRDLVDRVRQRVGADHALQVADVVPLRSGSLPRTSSGKPQRSAAREAYLAGTLDERRLAVTGAAAEAVADVGTAEPDPVLLAVQSAWSDVLGDAALEPGTDFFSQGADSLQATQIVSRLNAALDIDLPIRVIFEAPTLAQLTAAVRAWEPEGEPASLLEADADAAGAGGGPSALSFSQERMWFMHQLAPTSAAYNMPLALRLRGRLDAGALQRALDRVVSRHEILRTTFPATDWGVAPEVGPAGRTVVQRVDLSGGDPADDPLPARLSAAARAPFDLARGPLLRATLFRLEDADHVLLLVAHHMIGDQWSFAVLGRELAACYNAERAGEAALSARLSRQYRDYAAWHRRWFEAHEERLRAYWCRQLEGLAPPALNEDFPRPRRQSFAGATLRVAVPRERFEALAALGASRGASLSMVLLTAVSVLVARHSQQDDVSIGLPIANRNRLSAEDLIGTFVNTLVIRTDLSGAPGLAEALDRVRAVTLDAYAHQDMPFEALVRALDLPHDLSRAPLFNVAFNMINSPVRDVDFDGLTWSRLEVDRGAAQFDLTISADPTFEPGFVFEYSTDLFARDTVTRLAGHLSRLLDALLAGDARPVHELDLMSEAERALLARWRTGPAEPPVTTHVPGLLDAAMRRHGERVAVRWQARSWRYRELDAAVAGLAVRLRGRGLGRGDLVGLSLPRSPDMLIALLAILRTGAAYVPLDPDYPADRLARQVADAGLATIVTDSATARRFGWDPSDTLLLDADPPAAETGLPDPAPDAAVAIEPGDPAYVIYTSGSTGEPKGVAVPHLAVVNFLQAMAQRPGLGRDDRLLAVTTLSFDIAVLELLLPLSVGAEVVIADADAAVDGARLARLIEDARITCMQGTPSRWRLLLESGWQGAADLKALIGGEALPADLAARLSALCGSLWNMYGPTETTVWSTCGPVDPAKPISLGKPILNTTVDIETFTGHACPVGVPGEIVIGGLGVTSGYLHRAELTAARFDSGPPRRYRTGDLGRWRRDGSLEHLGRLDGQVKVRGYRIELGDVESHLLQHPGVARAVCDVRRDPTGEAQLVGFVLPAGAMPAADVLRNHLRNRLPAHMVPGRFVEVDAIPTLPNGKTDRQALRAVWLEHPADQAGAAPDASGSRAERVLLAICEEALGVDGISPDEDLFDLGAHSIMLVRLAARISAEFGVPCPVALLFEHPTPAALALVLMRGSDARVPGNVVTLQPGAPHVAPVFCLAGVDAYRDLAVALGAETPVLGLLSTFEERLLTGAAPAARLPTLESLAADYVAMIRRRQPDGPYRLVGFSIGGVLAYEVARQLRSSGAVVSELVMVDSGLPGLTLRHVGYWLRKRLARLRQRGIGHYAARARRGAGGGAASPRSAALVSAYDRMARRYRPGGYAGPVHFFQSAEDPIKTPGYGWRRLAPAMRIRALPAPHMEMLAPPQAAIIAAHIGAPVSPEEPGKLL